MLLLALALGGTGCALTSDPTGPTRDLQGVWTYTGTQASPALTLAGSLVVTSQNEDLIAGSLSWTESDGINDPVLRGGSMSGAVIGQTDVDFDVNGPDGVRRHVARISADTLEGVWVIVGSGRQGTFTAVRQGTP